MSELRRHEKSYYYYRDLDISKLMPAFMNIQAQDDMKAALDYITEHCIEYLGTTSKTVHNMAFFFHSKIEDPKNPRHMIDYLTEEEQKKADGKPIWFEVEYALNMCKQKEKGLVDRLEEDDRIMSLRREPPENKGSKR